MEEKQFEERPLGFLGNLFIEERMRISSFDKAFDDWKSFEHTMEFILRNPMVGDYNKHDEHRKERRREIRQLAKEWFGDHIRSENVELLVWMINSLRSCGALPERHREFNKDEVIEILVCCPEANAEVIETLDDDAVGYLTRDFRSFVDQHDLSHVDPTTMGLLYIRHIRASVDDDAQNKRGDDQQDAIH